MRVLFLSFPYASTQGGGERYTEQTVEGLMRAGHEVSLVTSSEALITTFKKHRWNVYGAWCGVEPVTPLAALAFPLTILIFTPFLFLLLAWFRYAHGVKTIVCLSLTEKLLATPLAKLFGLRVVWTEHLVAGRSLRMNPYRGWYVLCARLANVVTVSEAAASALAEVGVPRANIRVVSPGVRPNTQFMKTPFTRAIGVISRLSREKNVSLALRAFAFVVKELPDARLEIYGDGPERGMLARLADDLGISKNTTFYGYVESVRGAGRFSVLAVPSAKEAFGMAALEAMADGLPVVATRVGGLPEVVEHGKTGIVVPPNDQKAMAEALLRLLRNPDEAERLGEAGRARAALLFPETRMQNAWIELLSAS